jgi:hypothetical protein
MIQAIFEEKFRNELLTKFQPKFSNKTLKEDQFLHHVTLFYSKRPIDIDSDSYATDVNNWAKEGEEVFVILEELVWSDTFGVEAIVVTLKNMKGEVLGGPPNKTWHITVSTEGKSPVESNTLLNNRDEPSMRVESQRLNGIKIMARIKHYK